MQNNSDKFDHLIALAATKCLDEEARALNDLDTSEVKFDEAYYRKKRKIVSRYKRSSGFSLTKTIVIRIAAVLVIAVVLAGVLSSCVPGWREAIRDAIISLYDNYFTVYFDPPSGQEKETDPPQTVVVPTYIEEIRMPTGLSDDTWSETVVNSHAKFSCDYYIGEEYLFSFTQFLLKPNDKYVDNEDVDITYTNINGHEAMIINYVNKEETCIIWSDGEYSYQVFSSQCDIDTLLKYAKSVK